MSKGYLYDNGDELITREEAIPDTSEASIGDVLTLDEDKEPVWSAPSGGEDNVIYIGISSDESGATISFYSDYALQNVLSFGDLKGEANVGKRYKIESSFDLCTVFSFYDGEIMGQPAQRISGKIITPGGSGLEIIPVNLGPSINDNTTSFLIPTSRLETIAYDT